MDPEVIVVKGYSTFPKAPSDYLSRTSVGSVLFLCRDAVHVLAPADWAPKFVYLIKNLFFCTFFLFILGVLYKFTNAQAFTVTCMFILIIKKFLLQIKNVNISMGVPLGYYDFKSSPIYHPCQHIIGTFSRWSLQYYFCFLIKILW